MGGTWPYFDNERWGGPDGGRIPQEQFPGTFALFHTDLFTGTTDAVKFSRQFNISVFNSTGPDAATLGTPGANDVGKVVVLVNNNTTQTTVTTAANKIVNGTGTAGDTLTAPAHAGAVAVLVASNGYWNLVVGGTGSWVLSEV